MSREKRNYTVEFKQKAVELSYARGVSWKYTENWTYLRRYRGAGAGNPRILGTIVFREKNPN